MATIFPVLASTPVQETANALSFYAFVRCFAQSWGITICATILQNGLRTRLPAELSSKLAAKSNVEIAYAVIPLIRDLSEPLKTQVRAAFADSMRIIWQTMIGFAGAGFLTTLLLKEIKMHELAFMETLDASN